jgi:hypothetical protein
MHLVDHALGATGDIRLGNHAWFHFLRSSFIVAKGVPSRSHIKPYVLDLTLISPVCAGTSRHWQRSFPLSRRKILWWGHWQQMTT